ncbi:LacI family DNA-binding transcriptional regulator [Agromyces sp. S2-1-8]|uniref:LacI family DNA-binding transcriptional regulator n=1 Tax=Agromyces sp. S2-1-8 TaxID=2897180 RepID=UPI001E42CD5D|nr:LacI family DNA-binding transcriptional regulator [Agromyces sp. S2-1-8]MCD5345150.1 LacI family DNA-binding transcriptional regulator [Agromyces sp. S2-1-8]
MSEASPEVSGADRARARPVGVREVASRAGVSRQTVSRVLNDHPDVADETKQRVLDAMRELGYRMNNAARALGTNRSRTIGVLASDALQYGPSRSIAAVEQAARAAGYWVSAVFAESDDPGQVAAAVQHLQAQSVEGLVVVAPTRGALEMIESLDAGIPIVTLHSAGHEPNSFSVDQVAGARLAVACLADAGHRRIAHLAGPSNWLEAESRAAGFVAELAARGLETGPRFAGDWTAGSGADAAGAVLASGVTAVFVANDQMALGLLSGLREAGIDVPAAMSVVGFDDVPDAAYYSPPLTTVRQDFEELARRAVHALIGAAEGADEVPREPLVPELMVRRSVAAPPR